MRYRILFFHIKREQEWSRSGAVSGAMSGAMSGARCFTSTVFKQNAFGVVSGKLTLSTIPHKDYSRDTDLQLKRFSF